MSRQSEAWWLAGVVPGGWWAVGMLVAAACGHAALVVYKLKFPRQYVDLETMQKRREVRPLADVFLHALLFHYGVVGDGWLFQRLLGEINRKFAAWDTSFQEQGLDSRTEVLRFCRLWGVPEDPWPWAKRPEEFTTQNEFFTRKFKPGSAPTVGPAQVVAPATAVVTWYDSARRLPVLVKNERFVLDRETGVPDHEQFLPHPCTVHYLAPADYHRFHTPVAGRIVHFQLLDQTRYSVTVKPYVFETVNILKRNRRAVVVIEAGPESAGAAVEEGPPLRVAVMIIGGVTVDSIRMEPALGVGVRVRKSQPLGTFARGGSSVAMFFSRPVALVPACRAVHERGLDFKLQVGHSLAM